MKKLILTLAVTMFMGGTVTVMAQKTETKKVSTQDNSELEAYRKEVNEKIHENEKSITDFKERMTKEKQEVRAKYDKKIEQVEKKNQELKKRLAEYKEEDAKTNWQSFKKEFNHDMDELGKSLKDLTVNNVK